MGRRRAYFRAMRALAACAAIFGAAVTAGCTTGGVGGGGTAPLTETAPATAKTIAFEPLTGVPEDRAAALAEELVNGAVESGIAIVPRQGSAAAFRIKGYFSADRTGRETRITYVWDIFGASGMRVHRVTGTQIIAAALPDTWQAVTDDALRRIARQTVEDIAGWLARGAPTTSAASPGIANGAAASVRAPGFASVATRGAGAAATGVTIFVGGVSGAVGDDAALLARALSTEIASIGGTPVAHPDNAQYSVTGEATVTPVDQDAQTVALIWTIAERSGGPIGTVRQLSRVPANRLDEGWEESAGNAARAAAPALMSLIDGN